jgi:Flp pilus assembly protein TadD
MAPGDADPLNGLGVLAVQRGDMAEAARLLGAALEREPGQPDASLNLAFVEARAGDLGAARRRLQLLLRSSPPADVAERARRLLGEIGA